MYAILTLNNEFKLNTFNLLQN